MTAALGAAGYEVTGCDIRDGDDARNLFRLDGARYDLVIHAAAVVGGREQIEHNPLSLAVNLELDAAMFAWAVRTRPGRVVYLSSSAAYPVAFQGPKFSRPLAEDDISPYAMIEPDELYGWCKLTGERLARLARDAGVLVSVARPFSGYGEDQDLSYPFPAIAARARARQDPFGIWGTGGQTRDFIHVDDICAAILAMVAEGLDGPVNLGTGRATTMLALAGMCCAAAGYSPEYKVLPSKPSGVAHRVADITRMSQFCTPQVTLEEGVRRAVKG